MEENEDELLEQMLLARVERLNVVANGITAGLVCGLGLFVVTIVLVLKGGPVVGPHLWLLSQYLPGYEVTVLGSFIGLAYGLILGFVLGSLIATVYNRMADHREAQHERKKQE